MDKLDFGTPPPGKRGLPLHLEPRRKGRKTLSATRAPEHVTEGLEAKKTEILTALDLVIANPSTLLPHSFEWYYQSIEKVCRFRPVELLVLLGALFLLLKGCCTQEINPQLESAIRNSNVIVFLQAFRQWDSILRKLSKLFMYIDRTYLKQHRSKKMVYEFGIMLVLDHILATEGLRGRLIKMAAKELDIARLLLAQDPEKSFANSTDCIEFFKVLVALNYTGQLKTREIWIDHAINGHIKIIRHVEPENYYKTCEGYIKAENWFLEQVGESKAVAREFRSKVIWQWIFRDFHVLLERIVPYLLADELFDLYDLSTSAEESYGIDATQQLYHSWGQLVYKDTLKELTPYLTSKDPEMIQVVMKVLNKYRESVSLFKGKHTIEPNFEFELRNAIARAINTPEIAPVIALQLSRFCDLYFKLKSSPGSVDNDAYNIEHGLAVFKLINNKMAFLVTFKREFSRRLLFNKVSPEFYFERQFIKQLSAIVGQDDHGLQAMIDEIRSRVDTNISGVEFTPVVLLSKNWPEFPKSMSEEITLPKPLDLILEEYEKKYKHEQKRLDWSIYIFHQVVVQANFPRGTCELSTNLLQAAIVLLFNEVDKWSVGQIAARLNINERTARAGLLSLNEKYRILVKVGRERGSKDGNEDVYKFNHNFQDRGGQRLKVPPLKIQSEMNRVAQNEVDNVQKQRNRSKEIRALLTRLCKGRDRVLFEEMVSKAFNELEKTGTISVGEIEIEIQWLVQQEYLRREEGYMVYVP